MDNELIENENLTYETITNETVEETPENTVENETVQEFPTEKLDLIHQDLGIICSFLVIFALVIVFRYVYKFFNMFFTL